MIKNFEKLLTDHPDMCCEVEPKDYPPYFAYCSFCGEDAGYNNDGELILSNYCSNCGAIMDKEGTNGETVD